MNDENLLFDFVTQKESLKKAWTSGHIEVSEPIWEQFLQSIQSLIGTPVTIEITKPLVLFGNKTPFRFTGIIKEYDSDSGHIRFYNPDSAYFLIPDEPYVLIDSAGTPIKPADECHTLLPIEIDKVWSA